MNAFELLITQIEDKANLLQDAMIYGNAFVDTDGRRLDPVVMTIETDEQGRLVYTRGIQTAAPSIVPRPI